jgi:leader peptidase (prepilin peptidase)/N-methyltransferase
MVFFWYFVLFIFGLAVGSFINVISLRYQPGQKFLDRKIIGGRSHCPNCHKKLNWYELIPVISFLIQKGKCRHCGHRLSLQYPLVEILSGLIFVFVPLVLTYNLQPTTYNFLLLLVVSCWLLVFLLFLLLSIIDLRHSIIPDSINLSLAILGIILIVAYQKLSYLFSWNPNFSGRFSFFKYYSMPLDFLPLSIVNSQLSIVINHLFAALLGMFIFGLIIFFSRGRAMGMGDFKLIGPLGLIFGWPDILMVIALSFIIGAIVGIIFLIKKKKKIKDAIPFGPFLVIGSSLTFFFGYLIIDGYFKLFGL